MHVVGLRYYEAAIHKALSSGRLSVGCALAFRYNPVAQDPNAYAAYLDGVRIGSMPQFASQVLKAGNCSSVVNTRVRQVTGHQQNRAVIVDIVGPFESSPQTCSLSTPRSKGSGVYAIVNVRNMKAYIGCSQNIEERRREHLHALQCGTHFSPNLQRDWNSRQSAFAFVILKPPDQKSLSEAEGYFKCIYDAENPAVGYNQGAGFSPAVGRERQRQADRQASQTPVASSPMTVASNVHVVTYGNVSTHTTHTTQAGLLPPITSASRSACRPSSLPKNGTGCMAVVISAFVLLSYLVGWLSAGLLAG